MIKSIIIRFIKNKQINGTSSPKSDYKAGFF